jgi:hypothetical protein
MSPPGHWTRTAMGHDRRSFLTRSTGEMEWQIHNAVSTLVSRFGRMVLICIPREFVCNDACESEGDVLRDDVRPREWRCNCNRSTNHQKATIPLPGKHPSRSRGRHELRRYTETTSRIKTVENEYAKPTRQHEIFGLAPIFPPAGRCLTGGSGRVFSALTLVPF